MGFHLLVMVESIVFWRELRYLLEGKIHPSLWCCDDTNPIIPKQKYIWVSLFPWSFISFAYLVFHPYPTIYRAPCLKLILGQVWGHWRDSDIANALEGHTLKEGNWQIIWGLYNECCIAEVWTKGSCEKQGLRDEGSWRSFKRWGDPWIGRSLKVRPIYHCGVTQSPPCSSSSFSFNQ